MNFNAEVVRSNFQNKRAEYIKNKNEHEIFNRFLLLLEKEFNKLLNEYSGDYDALSITVHTTMPTDLDNDFMINELSKLGFQIKFGAYGNITITVYINKPSSF